MHFNCTCHPLKKHFVQTLNEWFSRKYNDKFFFLTKFQFTFVFAQYELVKTHIIHPEIFCPPKSATLKVFAFPASGGGVFFHDRGGRGGNVMV